MNTFATGAVWAFSSLPHCVSLPARSYIRQLNEIDPSSTEFRYTTAIEQTKAKLKNAQEYGHVLGIQNFADAMERLANYFEGLDSYLDDAVDCYHQMLADSYDHSY